MRKVLMQIQDTPYVLKGGTALLFARNLDRHSTDLDFDSGKRLNLEGRIREGLKASGVDLLSVKAVKDTDTVQRYKVHYLDPTTGDDKLLRIETSFRQEPDPESIEIVDGIKTYTASRLFDLKMDAAEDRTEARDLYDLAHLVREYGYKLSTEQIDRLELFSRNIDELATEYRPSFATDDVLKDRANVDDTLIALREAVEGQIEIRFGLDEGHELEDDGFELD
jgi:predicted nucleotidyltransferase component of viral defense system